ncbi:MAG TPA: SpoIID/LytB domain-containing protein [Gaiellaceae bacterium]|jgi:stage II sporulation protein D
MRRLILPLALLVAVVLTVPATHAARPAKRYVAPHGSGALFLITGHGFGHGVGMGQWGAQGYALHGVSYEEILAADYPGTALTQTTVRKIRVLLADGKKRLSISSDKPYTLVDGKGKTDSVPAGSSSFTAGSTTYPATFSPARGSVLSLSGTAYRGKFVVSLVSGRLRAVNVVSLQQYLDGNVTAEMPASWLPDALDAQAVASRSYALAGRKTGAAYDVLVTSQSYLGVAGETPQGTAAVDATKGQVLTYDGKVATTVYSSSTGGRTQSATDAWGGGAPYLVSVKDPYDTVSPWHNWGPIPVTGKALAAALKLSGKPVDATVKRNGSKRVAQLEVTTLAHGAHSPKAIAGGTVAGALALRSTWFSVGVLSLLPPSPNVAVKPRTTVTLTGTVRGEKHVLLQARPSGGSWMDLDSVTPDPATHAISIDVTPTATTEYRLATSTAAAAYIRITVSSGS